MSLVYYFLQQFVNALSIGSLYALMAVGLAMVFGILRLINFAHGDMMMVAAYIAAFALFAGLPLVLAIMLMVGGTVLIGLLVERAAYRPIRGAPDVAARRGVGTCSCLRGMELSWLSADDGAFERPVVRVAHHAARYIPPRSPPLRAVGVSRRHGERRL